MKEFTDVFSKRKQVQHLHEQTTSELFAIEKNLQKLVISEWIGRTSQVTSANHKLNIQKKNQLKVATIKSSCVVFTTNFSSITKGLWVARVTDAFDKITNQINEFLD